MPDLHKGSTMSTASSSDPASWYMPTAGETKKKKGFLSFLRKDKSSKFKPVSFVFTFGTQKNNTENYLLPPLVGKILCMDSV
jgi:hypothetical protein